MSATLPTELLQRLEEQFELFFYRKILEGFKQKRLASLRVNTLKISPGAIEGLLREKNIPFERAPFPAGLILKKHTERDFEKEEIYEKGAIYFQSLSSQLPALFLDPHPSEKILDMTAAPGSKTTQIAALMKNQGEILANELNPVRAERLKYNLTKQGVAIASVYLGNGASLGRECPETFDRVLLDAPCSAEGRIELRDPKSVRSWSIKKIHQYSRLQKQLFLSGYKALKPGGTLVYSTCTLAPEENEKIIDWALKRFPDLKLKDIGFSLKNQLPILTQWDGQTFSADLRKCLKLYPDERYEGFFIARLEKK